MAASGPTAPHATAPCHRSCASTTDGARIQPPAADRPSRASSKSASRTPRAELRCPPGTVLDRIALEVDQDPGERPLSLHPDPARRALLAQEEVAGDRRTGADRERQPAREPDRAADLVGEEQQQERDERRGTPRFRATDQGPAGRPGTSAPRSERERGRAQEV